MREEKNNNYTQIEGDTRLEFKQHNEFFQRYYAIRFEFIRDLILTSTDINKVKAAYDSLNALIKWTSSQLKKAGMDLDELKKDMKTTFNLIKRRDYVLAVDKLETLFDKVSEVHEKGEIIPKVHINEKDEILSEKDDKVKNALIAYNLIYEK